MSIQQNFPAISPSLSLNFARSKTLDPRITFTRTSSATRTNAQGLIEVVSTDTPRFDYSVVGVGSTVTSVQSLGLLIEESRTNLVTYSEQFDNAAWTKSGATITTNTSETESPDGSTNAEKLVENTANDSHYISSIFTSTVNTRYTISVFVKSAERTKVRIAWPVTYYTTGSAAMDYDLSLGTASVVGGSQGSSTASIVAFPNGWYRCIASSTIVNATTSQLPQLLLLNASGQFTYTGDGTSGIYIWGAQVEAGAFPTSYIPTVASTVTRSADNASITGSNFSGFYNPTEGTIVTKAKYDASPILATTNRTAYVLYNLTSGNMRQIWWESTNTGAFIGENPSGSYVIVVVAQTITLGSTNKIATAYKLNDFPICQNGGNIATDTSGTPPVTTSLFIGSFAGAFDFLNGRVSQLTYYPKRLSDSQLQNLTK